METADKRLKSYIKEKKIRKYIVYAGFFALAVFMHFYKLGSVPLGLHVDEAGMAYDAFCLANYSVDRYRNSFPVYFINYGGGQSALYTYLVVLLLKFGLELNAWTIRLPGALLAMVGYVLQIDIIRKQLGEKWGMLSGFLLAILPYFIMQARFGLDCNLLLNMSAISFWMLLKAKNTRKKIFYIIAGILYGISYYTYALGYITITIFLLGVLIYWSYFKQIKLQECILLLVPVAVIASPLLCMVIINQFDLPQLSILGVTIPRLSQYRASSLGFENIWNHLKDTVKFLLTRDIWIYNALDKYYTMYKISIPFAIVGFIVLCKDSICSFVKKVYFENCIFLFWVLIYLFLGSLIGVEEADGPNINRLNGVFLGLLFCILYGMRFLYRWFESWLYSGKKVKKESVRESLLLIPKCREKIVRIILVIYVLCFLGFSQYYFSKLPRHVYFREMYPEILQFIDKEMGEKTVYVQAPYIYYLLSAQVSPYDANLEEDKMESYGNIFFHLPPSLEEAAENSIYIVYKDYEEYWIKLKENPQFDMFESGMYYCFYQR